MNTISSNLPSSLLFLTVLAATLVCLTDWLFRDVLDHSPRHPLRAAAATLSLSLLTVGPAVAGVDTLVGDGLSSLTRALLWLSVGVVQTGLVIRLVFRSSLGVALTHGLILQLAWGAVSVLVVLCDRLGGLYCAAPLVLFLVGYVVRSTRERDMVRRLSSVPPTAPNAHPTVAA
jgi:hypothetical protein